MDTTGQDFESELRTSIGPVIAVLVALAIVAQFLVIGAVDPAIESRVQDFFLVVLVLLVAAYAVSGWRPETSKWFVVVSTMVAIELGCRWVGAGGARGLMGLPVMLAFAVLGFRAGLFVAAAETAILVPPVLVASTWSVEATAVGLVSIWVTLILLYLAIRPARERGRWAWEYCTHARDLVAEARAHKADLEQAMQDVVNANRQIALANERLGLLRHVADEARESKAAFVAKVSHEFRTPLNMIIGLVSLMVDPPAGEGLSVPAEMQEDLEIVHRNCEHLAAMIDDVLDLSQAEKGRVSLHKDWVDVGETITGALNVVQPLLDKKNLALQVDIEASMPDLWCDRRRIRQVILNLVSNAARFTEIGGISVAAQKRDGRLVVAVSDTGPGISPQDAEVIFEPFSQGMLDHIRSEGGSGLGLSISKQFIQLHHGRMWLESELGVGSTFFFELPLAPPEPPPGGPARWIRHDWMWRERAFATGKASVADDVERPRAVVLDGTGEFCSRLDDGGGAVELVPAAGMDELARELARCPAHLIIAHAPCSGELRALVERVSRHATHTPVIGCAAPLPDARLAEQGAAGYLTKPVTRADLRGALQSLDAPVHTVLIVDDDPELLALVTRMLLACDSTLQVVSASSGQQGLDAIRREHPDLVLVDVVMPDINGWQLLASIREDDAIADVPVIFLTAQDFSIAGPSIDGLAIGAGGTGLSLSDLLPFSLGVSALLRGSDRIRDRVPQ